MIDDKQAGKVGGVGPSMGYDTRSGPKRNDAAPAGSQDREKGKFPSFRLSSGIEKMTDLCVKLLSN